MIDANVISCLSEVSNEGFSGHGCVVLLIDAQEASRGWSPPGSPNWAMKTMLMRKKKGESRTA